jgi:hypothetical protein
MAENVEGSAANSMGKANSGSTAGFKDMFRFNAMNRKSTDGAEGAGSTGGMFGKKQTGNGWTEADYKAYGDHLQRHYDMHTNAQNQLRDADVARTQQLLGHAKDHGQVRSMNIDHSTGRQNLSFNSSPASATNAGNGDGGQGESTQQSQPGGRKSTSGKGKKAGQIAGAIAGALVPGAGETGASEAAGAAIGGKIGDKIESAIINRKPKGDSNAGKTAAQVNAKPNAALEAKNKETFFDPKRKITQGAINRQDKAAATYITPSNGKKLSPEVKAQNAAARTYMSSRPRGKKA